MKKSLWIVLLVVITLLLCGCERKTTPKEEVSAPLIETDPPPCDMEHSRRPAR